MSALPLSRATQRSKSSDVRDLLHYATLPGMISMAGGLPAAELFDVAGIEAAQQQVMRERASAALQYSVTEGQPRLREALAKLVQGRGIKANADQVLVTSGSQQSLDLIARAMLDEGDTVVLERPSYLAAIQCFQLAGASFLSISGDADGACVDELDQLPADARPKMVYVVSNFANPTGACLSLERRLKLLRWAVKHQTLVVEDDPYGALRFSGSAIPPLLALADQVPGSADYCAYISSLSKIMAPGFRLGFMILPPALKHATVMIKQAVDLHSSTLAQEVAASYLESGRLGPHVAKVAQAYGARAQVLAEALRQEVGSVLDFNMPDGGMFLWGRFNHGVNSRELLMITREQGLIFVPGESFYADHPDRNSIRLSFVTTPEAGLREGARRLAKGLQQLAG